MKAPCDSDSERCNNIQYMLDDGGFYQKCLAVLQLHAYFREGGPTGTQPLNSNNSGAALGHELHRKHRPRLWNRITCHVGQLVLQRAGVTEKEQFCLRDSVK